MTSSIALSLSVLILLGTTELALANKDVDHYTNVDLHKLHDAIVSSHQKHHNKRNLQLVDVGDALCLQASAALVGINDPGGLAGVFDQEDVDCVSGICDFDGTDYFAQAFQSCTDAGGFLITESLSICQEDLELSNNDLIFTNVPVCLATSCAFGTTYRDLLKALFDISALDGGTSELIEFENTFEGRCAPIEIQWAVPDPNNPYGDRIAFVGDTVVFYFGFSHNVFRHPSGDCSETGSVLVGSNGGPATYTFQSSEEGTEVTFACHVGNHCQSGQLVTFQVGGTTPSPTAAPIVVDSVSPTAAPVIDSVVPTDSPSFAPSAGPSITDSIAPSDAPVTLDSASPSPQPSAGLGLVSNAPTTNLDGLPLSEAPTIVASAPPSVLFNRKFPKVNNKFDLKLKRSTTIPGFNNGIRGRARQLHHFDPPLEPLEMKSESHDSDLI